MANQGRRAHTEVVQHTFCPGSSETNGPSSNMDQSVASTRQKRPLGDLEMDEEEKYQDVPNPRKRRRGRRYDFWCAEEGCSKKKRQINMMKEHMRKDHNDGGHTSLPLYWKQNNRWITNQDWEIRLDALMSRQKDGFTKDDFEMEKRDQPYPSLAQPDQRGPEGLLTIQPKSAGRSTPIQATSQELLLQQPQPMTDSSELVQATYASQQTVRHSFPYSHSVEEFDFNLGTRTPLTSLSHMQLGYQPPDMSYQLPYSTSTHPTTQFPGSYINLDQ